MKFPIDCPNCEYWDAWDLSFDDWVYYCGLLHIDIRECDIKKGHILPDCPLRGKHDCGAINGNTETEGQDK